MSKRNLISFFASIALGTMAAGASLSCKQTECGNGTIERDGTCVPGDIDVDNANCGEGTVLGPDGKCEAEYPPTVCQQGTTIPDETLDPGVITCVGTGGGGCDTDLVCPTPSSGNVSFCGRLYDVGTDAQIRATTPQVKHCDDPLAAQDGPCALDIKFYDALDFAGSPSTATPLIPEDFFVDDCGRYQASNIPRPALGFLGIGVDDKVNPGTKRLTGVAFPAPQNQARNKARAYVVTEADNQLWSGQASQGTSFVDQGAFMAVFYRGTAAGGYIPVAGVKITEGSPPAVEAANDWYFSDASPLARKSLVGSGQDATGVNGTGIKILSSLTLHSGMGGEPSGCTWSSANGGTVAGLLFFTQRFALNGTTECP